LSNDQGNMTSPTLKAMLAHSVAKLFPEINVAGLDKTALLNAVLEEFGWRSVFQLGQEVRNLMWHPVVKALIAYATPATIIRRWMSLERFGHSHNRISLLGCEESGEVVTLTIRHFSTKSGKIIAVNDLYIWGLIVGLLEAAAVTRIEASLIDGNGDAFVLHGNAVERTTDPLPTKTDQLRVSCRLPSPCRPRQSIAENKSTKTVKERLEVLFQQDFLHSWKVSDAARRLKMSTRSLQRALQNEKTTFTDVLKRTRVERAQTLLQDRRFSLTDIAFCVGFADQAHFTRTFRRYYDVPPSVIRDLDHKGLGGKRG
jgi:AraC-like DNA-binding protein